MAENTHLEGLNEPQKEAVLHKDGPLLIIAGAGAGKTRVLTHRILHLIKSGVAPEHILAITFTNKAAKEMQDRIKKLLGSEASANFPLSTFDFPLMCTFHSLGVRILREHGHHIGLKKHFRIFDADDAIAVIKQSLKTLGLDPKQFEPRRLANTISRQKGELVDLRAYAAEAHEYFPKIVAQVWEEYERALKKESGLDFDDLLLQTVALLRAKKDIHEEYQRRFRYIHIDEYQDTNLAQYELSKLLAVHKNICVVGDMDQCLPPQTKITTPEGEKEIQKIKKGDLVHSAAGHGAVCTQEVTRVHKRTFDGEMVEIHTKKGGVLSLTPGHITFADLTETEGIHYTYLMYRRDRGFRIGIVKGVRSFNKTKKELGLRTRSNQEHADRIWILRVSKTRAQAQYWEHWFAFTYGIPTTVFHTNGRSMDMSEGEVEDLYASIPTQERAKKLFTDTGLSFDYPHYAPQGTTHINTNRSRIKIRVTLCDDNRRSKVHPWGLSRIAINTTSRTLKQKLIEAGFSLRKGKRSDWRFDTTNLNYGTIEEVAHVIENLDPALSISRYAAITSAKRLAFHPAGNILPTMSIAYWNGRRFVQDKVTHVKKKPYKGTVYDLDVAHTHNYVAGNIPVHNSVYSWRGADFRNIVNFERDFANAKTVLLEENYRSTQTILAAANEIIRKNKMRKEKNLFTQKEDGEPIGLYGACDEADEAEFIAAKAQELIGQGAPPQSIAVLYRANFQSRVLEDAFLRRDIPYQVLGVKFFARKEVKDVLSFISAALNPDSATDIKRIINVPPRGIGKATIVKVFGGQKHALDAKKAEKVSVFFTTLESIRTKALSCPPSETVQFVIKESGMRAAYKKGTEEDVERLENIYELAELAKRYDSLPPEEGIAKLLEDAALAGDQDSLVHTPDKKQTDAVRLMTVHAAKGLEFPYVFVAGLEQGLFPHHGFAESRAAEERAEEERRLFYVALTRAEKKAFLSYASTRTVFGMKQVNLPSEFITDIPEHLLAEEEMPELVIH